MTTAFIADVHGNFEALRAVLAAIDRLGVDRIVCAGDVVGYHCQVNECCAELRRRGIPSVMGNHDWYLAGDGFCARSRSVNDCLVHLRRVIEPAHLEWLRGFPLQLQVDGVRVVHGGWSDPIDEYLKPSADYFARLDGRWFVSGHTHLQSLHDFGDRVYCNPGSVGQPRDHDPRAAFAVFDGHGFTLHRVAYDMQPLFDAMRAAGFDDYYYGGLATGSPRLRRLADTA